MDMFCRCRDGNLSRLIKSVLMGGVRGNSIFIYTIYMDAVSNCYFNDENNSQWLKL